MDEATWRALMEYLMGMGYLGPQSFVTGGGSVPGGGEPSSDQKRAIDFAQDYNSYLADPMLGALAGPQAMDAAAFQPIREYVEGPQNARLLEYSQKPLDTLEGWLADLIVREGALGVTAAAQQFLAADPEKLDPAQQKIRQQLEQFRYVDEFTGDERLDLDPLREMATELEAEKYLQADPNAQYEAETGRWYTETPSDLMAKFNELGLPSPYEEYDLYEMMGPDHRLKRLNTAGLQQDVYTQSMANINNRNQADEMQQAALAQYAEQMRPPEQEGAPRRAAESTLPQVVARSMGGAIEEALGPLARGAAGATNSVMDVYGSIIDPVENLAGSVIRGGSSLLGLLPGGNAAANSVAGRIIGDELQEPGAITDFRSSRVPGSGRRGGSSRKRDRSDAGNMTASANAKRRIESAEAKRAPGPSPTAQAYQKYVRAARDTYDDDFWGNYFATMRAREDGRTPLSDVLAARRAQGVISGVPIGWGG